MRAVECMTSECESIEMVYRAYASYIQATMGTNGLSLSTTSTSETLDDDATERCIQESIHDHDTEDDPCIYAHDVAT